MSGSRTVYLMRGLPSCGKSHTARKLAGIDGVVIETDRYFWTEIGDPDSYDYDEELLDTARDWAFSQFRSAIDEGIPRIVLDRGNGLNEETRKFATLALENGYELTLREPDSPWWQELKVLLKYKKFLEPAVLERWADVLADKSRETHRVPASLILRWMKAWRHDLTIEEILKESHDET